MARSPSALMSRCNCPTRCGARCCTRSGGSWCPPNVKRSAMMTFLLSPYPESPLLSTLSESLRSTTPRNKALSRDSVGFCYFLLFPLHLLGRRRVNCAWDWMTTEVQARPYVMHVEAAHLNNVGVWAKATPLVGHPLGNVVLNNSNKIQS